jgi:hypothetical protein
MIGCYLTKRSLTQSSLDCSTLLFQFIISFTFGQFEKKENKIDVLSEEPYPLRRGGATGRANRLMMCDDRDDDARDGPALRSSGTRLVVRGVPGERESRMALGYTYHHLSTIMLLLARSDTW